MFPGGTPFGFYNAPVSKALIAITGAASALNILLPALKISKNVVLFNHFHNSQVFCAITRNFYYSNVKNLVFGSILLYSFRMFEHRYGSTKFANHLIASSLIRAGIQYATLTIMANADVKPGEIPTGPFGIIFSLFVPFFLSVPATGSSNFFGLIPVTGKLLTYIIGLQMLLLSRGALVSGISGLAAGVVCHFNIFYVQRWLKLPDSISNLAGRIFGAFFRSSAPANEGRIHGATLEIQRQQRMDELDRQYWRLQEGLTRRPTFIDNNQVVRRAGHGYPDVLVGHPDMVVGDDGGQRATQQPTTEVSEEQVQRLIEMGFTRQAVLQALTASNNDMAVAMNILLAE